MSGGLRGAAFFHLDCLGRVATLRLEFGVLFSFYLLCNSFSWRFICLGGYCIFNSFCLPTFLACLLGLIICLLAKDIFYFVAIVFRFYSLRP